MAVKKLPVNSPVKKLEHTVPRFAHTVISQCRTTVRTLLHKTDAACQWERTNLRSHNSVTDGAID